MYEMYFIVKNFQIELNCIVDLDFKNKIHNFDTNIEFVFAFL